MYVAGFLRSMGVGLLGVVLGVYLSRIGLSATRIGFVLAAGLAGISVSTALTSVWADRLGRRRTMMFLTLLSALGGVALAGLHSLAGLLPVAFVAMLNGMGTDRSAIFALEQAILPGLVRDDQRTWALAWYNVLLDSGGAVGSLAAGLPVALEKWQGLELLHAYRYVFLGYTALNVFILLLYSLLPEQIEVATRGRPAPTVSPETKKTVHRMAALFGLDSLGGGFLGDALVAYWFFRRFGLVEQTLGVLFFVVRILNALSHLGAAWLSRKIGLVNTMVFTHLPSSLFLICVPLMKSPIGAIAFFLARESLVEMDVPTRQSYVAAVVKPHERTYASGVTNLTRTVAWAVSSSMAGAVMQYLAFSAPLVLGGSMKIAYDILLFRGFRKLKPPEEVG
ncbi:MAG: MFS transporter [Proteobacteria bacterium]|nr:MAG: MFS transporter [Pseudomonadota bacterium]